MKIAILAPSDKSFISHFLPNYQIDELPDGFFGAPFIGILIKELLNRGHEIIAITTTLSIKKQYEIKEYNFKNFKWIVVPYRKFSLRNNGFKLGRILDLYAFERKLLLKAILMEKPDFIHAHWSYEYAGAASKSRIPHLLTIHDNPFQVLKYMPNFYRFGRLLMAERILRQVKFVSTVSPYMVPYVQKRCKQVKVIPNPTLIDKSFKNIQTEILEKLKTIDVPKIIMVMNGWDSRKNGLAGLKAFVEVRKIMPKATLHLFGNGTEKGGNAYLEAKSLQLSGIFFNGPVNHSSLLQEISNAHILVHPSLEESFGVVLIEAMGNGVPVIGGLNSGAVPWVIDNENLLVDVVNFEKIEGKIIEVLSDKITYKKMADKCFVNAHNRFSAKSVVDQYEAYYKEIMLKW